MLAGRISKMRGYSTPELLEASLRTIADPSAVGCAGAWALDFDQAHEPRVVLLSSLAGAPERAPAEDEIFIWLGSAEAGCDHQFLAPEHLGDDIFAQAMRLRRDSDRRSFIVAHAALRHMLANVAGIPQSSLRIWRDENGKPHLANRECDAPPIHFNVSHTNGLAAVAIAGHPVGIDVEAMRDIVDMTSLAQSVLAPESIAALHAASENDRRALFFRFWCLGEAFIKATGIGMGLDLASFAFTPAGVPKLTRISRGWGPIERWRFGLLHPDRTE